MMTRKDFELIARAVKGSTIVAPGVLQTQPKAFMAGAREQTQNIAHTLADYLAGQNPRFDRAKFLAACGVQS